MALLLCLCLTLGMLPPSVFAAETAGGCNHVHDGSCGYAAATEGHACGHVHDTSCGYIGKDAGRFDPTGMATRAEVAAVLRRFVEVVIDPRKR